MTSPARWILHRVAFAHVEPRDLAGIVQRGVLHHDAADGDRLELGDRRERAGAADLDLDVLDDGGRLLGREFMRDRPARRARHEAEPLLPIEAVDLVDDAVDIVVEAGALRLDVAVELQQRVDRAAHLGQRIGLKAATLEPFDHAGLGVGRHLAHLAPGIGEKAERPRCGDRRVELAQRAGRGVARIDVELLAGFRLLAVKFEERGFGHVDFAAHLAHRRHAFALEPVRNVLERFDVGGDVLAFGAVAARRAGDEHAVLVAQRHRQAVDLRLGGERDFLVLRRDAESGGCGRRNRPRLLRRRHCRATASAPRGALWQSAPTARRRPAASGFPACAIAESALRLRCSAAAARHRRHRKRSARRPDNSAGHARRSRPASRACSALACFSVRASTGVSDFSWRAMMTKFARA